jgi:hypothetical protein
MDGSHGILASQKDFFAALNHMEINNLACAIPQCASKDLF